MTNDARLGEFGSGWDLVFLENRRTPKVVRTGTKYEPKPSEGRITKRRKATAEERKVIERGDWVRVNERGETPGDSGYMKKKSKVRPQNNAMGDFKYLWSPDGAIIATAYVSKRLLPVPRPVERSSAYGWPDGDEPAQTMVALRIPPHLAEAYPVPDAPGVEPIPLDDRHITLAYLGKLPGEQRREVHQRVREWLAAGEWSTLQGSPSGWGTFNQDGDRTVLWMGWDIPGLPEMRQDLVDDLSFAGLPVSDDHGFMPHETAANVDGALADIPAFPESPKPATFSSIIVAEGDRWTSYDFPMTAAIRQGASMSLAAALEQAVDPELEHLSDDELNALIAAGGLDRNRGNAERLRRYWTIGPGGAKIRWNTPGDWKRCVRHLSKHLGPRAKGYCQLRHKEMTRMHTGDMKHRIMYGWGGKPGSYWAKVAAKSAASTDGNHTLVAMGGQGGGMNGNQELSPEDAGGENPLVMLLGGEPVKQQGFRIPLLLPEGEESGDGRTFKKGVVEVRELPIPLLWQPQSMQGHDGSVIVGRIDSVERTEEGLGNARGVFDTSPVAQEAVRLIREKFLRGVSADLDKFEAKMLGKGPGVSSAKKKKDDEDDDVVAPERMDIQKGRVMAATLVAKPAFERVVIELDEEPTVAPVQAGPAFDGTYRGEEPVESMELAARFAEVLESRAAMTLANGTSLALVASGFEAPIAPPEAWFADPGLDRPTHLTITDDGRVFGHIAAWHVDHIGMGFGTRPPHSRSNYAYFRTGEIRTAEGTDVRVGQLTLTGGHAPLNADANGAVRHYDDTQSAFADVSVGEDRHGIWVAGALRPGITPEQVRAARASSPSGDWRPINGKLELVAVCQVNVPGFPVVEARVASGAIVALVAAGAPSLTQGFLEDNAALVAAATAARETIMAPLAAQALQVQARMARVKFARAATSRPKPDPDSPAELAARTLELQARMARARFTGSEFKDYSPQAREKYAEKGIAMEGGRYPIKDATDLKNAIKAYGRGNPKDKPAIRRHIIKRAKALGHPELIPDAWKEMNSAELAAHRDAVPRAYSRAQCIMYAQQGHALPDGSLPIRDEFDVRTALLQLHLLPEEQQPLARIFVKHRARQLGIAVEPPSGPGALTASAMAPIEFRQFDAEQRKALAKKGHAMKDGSYPIVTLADLRNAIKAYGRSKKGDRAKVRRHIIKRAKALGHPELIPDNWKAMTALAAAHGAPRDDVRALVAAAAPLGAVDFLPPEMDAEVAELLGLEAGLIASIRSVRRKSWDESKIARDDIGRFRKIYYRLRRGGAAEKPKVKMAMIALKEAAEASESTGSTDAESASVARDLLEDVAMEGGVDERTQLDLMDAAQEMSDLVSRVEARGDNTMISVSQLPQEIRDALTRYLKESPNLEERISTHFDPFVGGETSRSVKDILNLLERVIIDAQRYHKGYDTERI